MCINNYVLKWNLDNIFNSTKDFYNNINEVKELLVKIKRYEDVELDSNTLCELLDSKWKIRELANNILLYGSLMYYSNVNSSLYINMKTDAENFNNEVTTSLNFIDIKILNIGEDNILNFLENNKKLLIYRFALNNLFRLKEHYSSKVDNLKISNNNKKVDEQLVLYNNLLNSIKYGSIIVAGKKIELNSLNINQYISNRNRDIRMNAYLSVYESFSKEKDKFFDILKKICDCRKQNAKYENYNTVLEKILFEENIDISIINSLIKSVNNNIDLIQKYLKMKAEFIGIEEAHLYDFNISITNELDINYTLDESIDIIKKALEPLGNKYLEVVEALLDGHIDAYINENKHQSIIFSWNTYSFMNFRGRYVDLKNLIHEIGHIVNYYLSKEKQPYIYEDGTVFIGETSSIVNEILLNRYLYNNATSKEEKIFYLSKEIENYFTSIFKQTMYTEFEQEIYNSNNLSCEYLSNKYRDIVKKYYGNGIVYDDIFKFEWTRLGHLFRHSYYVYKYATGLLIASIIVNGLENGDISNDKYLEFLSLGSSNYSLELLKFLGIDLCDNKVINNGFNILKKDIDNLDKMIIK